MTITALPTPPSNTDSPANFAIKAGAFVAALPQLVTQINAEVMTTIPAIVGTVSGAAVQALIDIPAAVALVDSAVAQTAAGQATVAKKAAESARDAALIQAGVYTTEALGRAAVADLQAFKVQGSGDIAALEYRRINSTTSVLIASYPSSTSVHPALKSIKPSQNLFDVRRVLAGKINQGNNYYGNNAGYGSTMRIPVLPGEVYFFSKGDNPVADTSEVYTFAVSPSLADNPITVVAPVNGSITIPAENFYLSFSAQIGLITDATRKWQLTKGAIPTRFWQAGYFIDPDFNVDTPLYTSYASIKAELDRLTTLPALTGIKEEQVGFLSMGKNQYRHANWQWGYSINTATGGLNVSGTGWVTSDYTKITPAVANFVSSGYMRESNQYFPFCAYYDINLGFINTPVVFSTDAATGMSVFTPPANARYVRVSTSTIATAEAASATLSLLMVSVGYVPQYEAYGYTSNGTTARFKDADLLAYSKPLIGKRAALLGDSITMQGRYFSSLCSATGIDYLGSKKSLGQNGQILREVGSAVTTELLTGIDVVTVLAGTNDYGHGSYPLGTVNDTKETGSFYGSIYYLIDRILTAKSTVRIVFFTPLQRGLFGTEPNPYAAGYPNGDNPGSYGLTMPAISNAIVQACRIKGIACLDLFGMSGCNDKTFLNYYPSDDILHPHQAGADRIGRMMGQFMNTLM